MGSPTTTASRTDEGNAGNRLPICCLPTGSILNRLGLVDVFEPLGCP